jgi:hypothetical protein
MNGSKSVKEDIQIDHSDGPLDVQMYQEEETGLHAEP